jgi:hypothetical protein
LLECFDIVDVPSFESPGWIPVCRRAGGTGSNTCKEELMSFRWAYGLLGSAVIVVGCAQSDAGITTSVKSQLAADDLVKARRIDVDTADRVVTLRGEVNTAAEEAKALEIARATNGVTNVIDEINIVAEPASPTTGTFEEPGAPTPEPAPEPVPAPVR